MNTKLVANLLGCGKLRFADPDVLEASFGVKPGSVSIFGLLHSGSGGVEVVIDGKLVNENELGFHPNDNTSTIFISGDNTSTIFISGKDLGRIVQATGHTFCMADL